MAQTSSYVTATDQSKVVLQIEAMRSASNNVLQQKHSCFIQEIRLLLSTCASLYCSHAKQIKEDLDDIE